jgi:hypothetical protein
LSVIKCLGSLLEMAVSLYSQRNLHCISFFGTVLRKNCIALSQSELRNFFMYIISLVISWSPRVSLFWKGMSVPYFPRYPCIRLLNFPGKTLKRFLRMPKKNEHGDVFLRVRIYKKCSSHNHKTIKRHSNQTNTPRAIPSVIIILQTNNMTRGKLAINCPSPREHSQIFPRRRAI